MDGHSVANEVAMQTHAVSTRDSTTIIDTPHPVNTTTIMTGVTSHYNQVLEDECVQSTSRLDKTQILTHGHT